MDTPDFRKTPRPHAGIGERRILIIGFGSIGQGLLPLLLQHFPDMDREHVGVIAADNRGREIAEHYGVCFERIALTEQNFERVLDDRLSESDVLLNVSVEVASVALIAWCQAHRVLYLDTCVEPWAGGYVDASLSPMEKTNYGLRRAALAVGDCTGTTAVIAHGANPGLVSHFVKRALRQVAAERHLPASLAPAEMARELGLRAIHIAERDTQDDGVALGAGEFANTWSVDGMMSEVRQLGEIGLGTHEDAQAFVAAGAVLTECSCVLPRASAMYRIASWVPSVGEQEAFLITHHEAVSLANFLTVRDVGGAALYRPTVFYAYRPCPKTVSSIEAWLESGFAAPTKKTVMKASIRGGFDELGVLLVFDDSAYWYGSMLSNDEAASLVPHNSATTLQATAGALGALVWMLANPRAGVIEAERMNDETVLSVAAPFLGRLFGVWAHRPPTTCHKAAFADTKEGT
jgi:homospermidine synthase